MKKMVKDLQARKYFLVINNPDAKGFTHDVIKDKVRSLRSTTYFCMSDEIGNEEKTLHTHIFIAFSAPVRFSTMKNTFPDAHIEKALGNAQQAKDYILKEGPKWANKKETSIPNTFYEEGTLPQEKQGKRSDLEELYDMIKDNYSNYEIFEENPKNIRYVSYIDRVRNSLAKEKTKNVFREVKVTYIYGKSGVGKTRYCMELRGYEQIFRVTDYKNPFDNYAGQLTVCFDEFNSSFKIREMLNYMDGYPLELSCRYSNKWANYTELFIVSNLPIEKQYVNEQIEERDVWDAFLRRITTISHFLADGSRINYTPDEYFDTVAKIPEHFKNPFDE